MFINKSQQAAYPDFSPIYLHYFEPRPSESPNQTGV